MCGTGKMLYTTGDKYEGQWKRGRWNGEINSKLNTIFTS
jgi:hypothetical protein